MLISVIVPVFNCRQYLGECLSSILGQTQKDFEIIIMDDGSTDGSGELCDLYAKKDSRINVHHQTNCGIGLTRRNGVLKAKGQYVFFVDADDWIEQDLVERIQIECKKNVYDLIQFGHWVNEIKFGYTRKELSRPKFIEDIVMNTIVNGQEAVVMWNKVYRRELLLEAVEYWGNNTLEDYVVNLQYYMKVQSYICIEGEYYHYRISTGSLTRTFNEKAFNEAVKIHNIKIATLTNPDFGMPPYELWKSQAATWFVNYVDSILLGLFVNKSNYSYKQRKDKIVEIISDKNVQKESMNSTLKRAKLFSEKQYTKMYLIYLIKATIVKIRRKAKQWIT